jgi:hypothetical protein
MHLDDMLKQYKQEWLLIEVKKFDENWNPIDGKVIFHSPSDDDVLKEMLKLKGKKINLATRFAGKFPDDLAVLL